MQQLALSSFLSKIASVIIQYNFAKKPGDLSIYYKICLIMTVK